MCRSQVPRRLEAVRAIQGQERLQPEVSAALLRDLHELVVRVEGSQGGLGVGTPSRAEDDGAAHDATSFAPAMMSSSESRTKSAAGPRGM